MLPLEFINLQICISIVVLICFLVVPHERNHQKLIFFLLKQLVSLLLEDFKIIPISHIDCLNWLIINFKKTKLLNFYTLSHPQQQQLEDEH